MAIVLVERKGIKYFGKSESATVKLMPVSSDVAKASSRQVVMVHHPSIKARHNFKVLKGAFKTLTTYLGS